jgi:hypothetical protein
MKYSICIASFAILLALPVLAQDVLHDIHVIDNEMGCAECHPSLTRGAAMPTTAICLDCHDADEGIDLTIASSPGSHFGDYRHEHQFMARLSTGECVICHGESETCTSCHHGENVDFLSHNRNHRYSHALDAMNGTEDCYTCHGSQDYCNGCHLAEGVKPASHFESGFGGSGGHTNAARNDIGSCMMCHDGPEVPPSCVLCHG